MATVKDFKEQLDEYCKRYNLHGPKGLPKGAKPSSALSEAWHIKEKFLEEPPNSREKGCYLFTDRKDDLGEVIYIGKSSLGADKENEKKLPILIGDRWSSKFNPPSKPDPGGLREGWKELLRGTEYLRTIPFPFDYAWEIAGLEEWLIARLKPRGNTVGVMPGVAVQLPPLGTASREEVQR